MKDSKLRRVVISPYLWLFLITSLLFGVLFIQFILGDYAYVYVDMGGDTFDINYPLYYLFSNVFHGGGYENYFLNVGLGMDMSSYLFQYLNPLNLLVVMLPASLIPWGVLLATYLKLILISMFGYKLFLRWIGHPWGSFVAALLWTFSSYVMLWGQHYGFCTSVMMFTIFLYLVHLFVEDGEKSRNWLLVLWITLMLFTNYYFLYMSGIIGAMYVIIYLAFHRESWKKILVKLLGLAGMGALGICIGGVCLIPTYNIFQGSTRAGAVNLNHLDSMLRPYKPKWLYGFLARLISNNTMGIANKYTGAGNYYEIAMIFTSSLFFVSLPYLLSKKGMRLKTLFLTVLSVVFLIFPFSGKLFTMNTATQRWSFILCMLEAFAVGMFVKLLLTEREKKRVSVCVAVGVVLTGCVYGLLFWGQAQKYFKLKEEYLIVFAVFMVIYGGLILLKSHSRKIDRVFLGLLAGVICVELVAANYPTINFRKNPTRNQVAVEYYNDGTREAWNDLRQQDDSLYRVSKTYESGSENDGMAQGYPGMSVYLTTNPKELIQLKEMYGGTGVSDNFVYFNNDNFLLNSLLGVKYMLANPGDGLSEQNYAYVKSVGSKDIYENQNALPFGYLYDHVWSKEQVEEMTEIERTLAAVHGFYFSDEDGHKEGDTAYSQAVRQTEEGISLMDREFQAVDCQGTKTEEGIVMSNMTNDPHIEMKKVQDAFGEGAVHTITMKVKAPKKVDMALYYKTARDEGFRQDQIYIFHISPKNDTWIYTVPGDITDIRIDVSTEISDVTIQDIRVSNCPSDNKAYEKLQNTDIRDIAYTDNTYQATINNNAAGTQMLCIPFLYSEGWQASLDGEPVNLYDINSGLCGVEIPAGTHQVTLQYNIPHEKVGIALSLGGIFIYLLWIGFGAYRRRHRDRCL